MLHRRADVRAAAAIPAIGLLAGSACGLLAADVPFTAGLTLLVVCGMTAGVGWWAQRSRVLAAAVGLAFFVGGALLAGDAWHRVWHSSLRTAFEELARADRAEAAAVGRTPPEQESAFAIVTGTLTADATPSPSGGSLSIEVDELKGVVPLFREAAAGKGVRPLFSGGILATVVGSLVSERMDEWRAGRRVRFPIQLRRPSRYLDPGVPDHERALARRGTILVGTVKSAALVEVVARGNWINERFDAIRAFGRLAISQAVGRWSARSSAIVAAIVIGDRAGLDDEVQHRLQEAGTYHVIAISGGNIAILAGLMLGMFRLAGLLGRSAMVASIVALVGYGYLVGGGASVDRATLMAVVSLAGRAIDQRSPPLNTLAFVAACLVATQPFSVVDPAFILTFGATLAILVVMPLVANRRFPRAVAPMVTLLAASVATEAMLFPVGALMFSRVTFAGLVLNFVAIPLMGVAQVAGMALVPAALVSARLAGAIGVVAHLGAAGLVRSAELVRFMPAFTWRVAPPSWLALALYYLGLAGGWTMWRRREKLSGSSETAASRRCRRGAAALALGAAAWILAEPWAFVARRGDGRLHVIFIDVGQGDAALVRFPRGKTLLVDTGGLAGESSFDIGERVVAPVLRTAGARRLDGLVLTHGDPDHIGGAISVVREFRPREVWEGIPVPRFEPLRAVRAEALGLGLRWANVTTGDRVEIDDVEVIVRHPDAADWERPRVRNDDSIVIELRWHEASILLTGDIGKAVELALATAIPRAALRVVKVPHHGSLTSSTPEFVRALAPRVAVVSVGRGNRFGHPAAAVLERYREAGAEIFRTDRDGAVTVDTDGYSLSVSGYTGRTFSTR
ncbi:MAG: DNA internalization-related competence protein ComEC/Rec2 [Acidobacteria bacterium]|nr:MAG: DNA internalization-related competence protein ComEC/Rec2 [Acidobacteriota bacterium]